MFSSLSNHECSWTLLTVRWGFQDLGQVPDENPQARHRPALPLRDRQADYLHQHRAWRGGELTSVQLSYFATALCVSPLWWRNPIFHVAKTNLPYIHQWGFHASLAYNGRTSIHWIFPERSQVLPPFLCLHLSGWGDHCWRCISPWSRWDWRILSLLRIFSSDWKWHFLSLGLKSPDMFQRSRHASGQGPAAPAAPRGEAEAQAEATRPAP